MDNLTDYEKEKFSKLDTIPVDRWLNIDQNREDLRDFMICLYKYSNTWFNCLVFDYDANKFKRIIPKPRI